jgi:hypothetical protein
MYEEFLLKGLSNIFLFTIRLEVINPVPCTPAAPRCGYQNQGFCGLPGYCCLEGTYISELCQGISERS